MKNEELKSTFLPPAVAKRGCSIKIEVEPFKSRQYYTPSLFLHSKTRKASSAEPGHPLCAARVENEKLFERKRVIFRLAGKHIAGRLCAGALTFFCILFLCQDKKRMSGLGADSPEEKKSIIDYLITYRTTMKKNFYRTATIKIGNCDFYSLICATLFT